MIAMAHEPHMQGPDLLQAFLALDTPEGYRAELIDGEVVVTTPPGGDHEEIIGQILWQVGRKSPIEIRFSQNKGLRIPRGGEDTDDPDDHVIPDATLAPAELGLFRGASSWMPQDGVTMVLKVTSNSARRDRVSKRHCYARGRIPYYLLVDRPRKRVFLYSGPDGEDYREAAWVPFGKPIALPDPFAFELDTSGFY